MKKILILLCILFLFSGTASAKIKKEVDKFDGKITITSNTGGEITRRIFDKRIYEDEEKEIISLSIFKIDKEWYFFSRTPFEFKIDGIIYETKPATTISRMQSGELITGACVIINNELEDKILNANTVILRYHFNNQPSETWNVPTDVLSEWKKVIQAKK